MYSILLHHTFAKLSVWHKRANTAYIQHVIERHTRQIPNSFAKDCVSSTEATARFGDITFTPAYMAPELARAYLHAGPGRAQRCPVTWTAPEIRGDVMAVLCCAGTFKELRHLRFLRVLWMYACWCLALIFIYFHLNLGYFLVLILTAFSGGVPEIDHQTIRRRIVNSCRAVNIYTGGDERPTTKMVNEMYKKCIVTIMWPLGYAEMLVLNGMCSIWPLAFVVVRAI